MSRGAWKGSCTCVCVVEPHPRFAQVQSGGDHAGGRRGHAPQRPRPPVRPCTSYPWPSSFGISSSLCVNIDNSVYKNWARLKEGRCSCNSQNASDNFLGVVLLGMRVTGAAFSVCVDGTGTACRQAPVARC